MSQSNVPTEGEALLRDLPSQPEQPAGGEDAPPVRGALFTQQQVNDIAARESAKALERLFREAGYPVSGRAREQQKEFVAEFSQLRQQLAESEGRIGELQTRLEEAVRQKQQQEGIGLCLSCGVRPAAVGEVLRLLPDGADPETRTQSLRALLQKYPFFAARPEARSIPVPFAPAADAAPQDKLTSIAKKMGLA